MAENRLLSRRVRGAVIAAVTLAAGALGALGVSAPAHAEDTTTYVALGDSYVAGPGVDNTIDEKCARSDSNYPSVAAEKLPVELTDVSCSGAITDDMTSPQKGGDGNERNAPQLDALSAETDIVTLGIGGNDIGFTEIAQTCVTERFKNPGTANPCEQYYTQGSTDELKQRISATQPKVEAVLAEITQRAPDAAVFVVGYPTILPDGEEGCSAAAVADGDVPYLRDTVIGGLNAMLSASAQSSSATYVDLATPTKGHDLCQNEDVRYINPITVLDPDNPGQLHPNAAGMAAFGEIIAEELKAALPDDNGNNPTPSPTPTPTDDGGNGGGDGSDKDDNLPNTGTQIAILIAVGAAIVCLGVALVALPRRRKNA